jgi:serine/threonine protein kinase
MELSTSSISNEIDKSIKEDFSVSQAAIDEIKLRKEKGQKPESISNEEIKKGNSVLGTYKVLDDAIHGGMGSVWRVHHESWNTNLVMKRPQPRFFAEGSEARKEEFIKECENWINLGLHPNIVSCYYVREIGGVPTIFSEWMDNGSLKDRIKDGSLYEGTEEEVQERILDIAIQTARGLQYSHENGLVHQDVKPGNILLTKDWDAKVADFGLAKAQSQLTENKKPVSTGYTIQYCPREQAEGAPAEKWMDVYAWALTVLEMYAGKRLWDTGAEAKELFDTYPAQCAHAIPDKLQTLLKVCLTDSANDFQSIGNALIDEYRNKFSIDYPRPASKAAADTADSLNNRALSMLDLGMPEEAEKLWDAALRNDPGHVDAIFNRAIFRWTHGKGTDMHLLEDLRAIPDSAQREKLENLAAEMRGELQKGSKHRENCADKIEGTSNIFDLKAGDADYCPAPDCNGYIRTKKGKNIDNTAVTLLYRISQDGETCSFLDTYPEQYTTVHEGSVSRDGRYIVLNNSGAISLYDSKEAKLLWTRKFRQYSIRSACAGTDGKNCYIGKEDGIYEFDLSSFSERRIYSGKDILAMKLDPNNMILLFREDPFAIKLLDLYSEKIIATAELESEPQWYELTQDGKSLLVGVGNVLEKYNLESGKRDRLFTFADADTDGKPKLCCISGSYALRYTSSYCSIWDMKKGICLRSIRYSGIIAARLTKIGSDGMLRGFIITCYPVSFNTFVIPAEPPKPHWQLCRIRKTAEQIRQDEAFYTAVEETQQAVKQQDWEMARESLAKVRSVESRKNDPVCLQLYDTLYPHFRRGRLLQYIPVQTIGEKVAMRGTIAFSDDGSFLLAGTNQGRVVFDVRSGKQILLVQECKDIKFVHGGTCVAAIQRESEEKARLLIYALQSAISPEGSRPEAKLLGNYSMKYGLHPYIEEAEGTIYARSQSFFGGRVDAAADAVSGEFLHIRKKPKAEKPDTILKAAKKDGMQYVSYGLTRMTLDNGITAFCCRDWIEAEKRYVDNLWIYDAQGKQLRRADFSELELKNIKPLEDGLISAERGDKLYLIEAKDYLECDNPIGYELTVEQKFGGMRSEGYDGKYKAVKGEYWGITISRDCRFLFLSGTVYRLEWELES